MNLIQSKIKTFYGMASVMALATLLASCSTHDNNNATPTKPVSNPITDLTLGSPNSITNGTIVPTYTYIKGTMLAGKTYTMAGDLYVKETDTLVIQPGVRVVVNGNLPADPSKPSDQVSYALHISGTLLCQGTKEKPISFGPPDGTVLDGTNSWPNAGWWGGIQCDSLAKVVTVQWTNISYTGGPDVTGGSQFAFSVVGIGYNASQNANSGNTKVIFEDNKVYSGVDDGIRLTGPIKVSIRRNLLFLQGGGDGDNINVKRGVTGDLAYNYIWSAANNSIKLETSNTLLTPITNVNIFNNTIIAGGWRKTGETTAGILIDRAARASVYNNIIANTKEGIRITNAADVAYIDGKYGNNLFYTTVDSTRQYFYPANDWGKAQSSDILSTGVGDKDPMFVKLVSISSDLGSKTNQNDPHLQSGSPAIGKGNVNAPVSNLVGDPISPNKDLGAYPTDGKGNQRID